MSRKKTTTEKVKTGTIRADRVKKLAAPDMTGLPEPTADLSADEMKMYTRLCKHLQSRDVLFDADAAILTAAAVAIVQNRKAIQALHDAGPIQYFDNGTRNVSPEYSTFEKTTSLIARLSKSLGLDPKSRQDMTAFLDSGEAAPDDPSDELMPS